MMAVGAFLAAVVLAVGFRGEAPKFWGAVGLMLVAGLPTLPAIFKRLARLAGVARGRAGDLRHPLPDRRHTASRNHETLSALTQTGVEWIPRFQLLVAVAKPGNQLLRSLGAKQ